MLYLSTGGNGSGKTLFSLYDVRQLQLKTNRPVFYVKDRFRAKAPIEEFGWQPFEFKDWQELPDGAIIFADECHRDMPTPRPTKEVPPHLMMLAEHRVRGFDFFFCTQHPGNIDIFVRRLVQAPGWHRHFKRLAGALSVSNELRWDAVNLSAEQAGSGTSAETKARPFPREVYDWYESATLHTGRVRIPKAAIIFGVALVAVPALLWFGVKGVRDSVAPEKPAEATGGTTGSASVGPAGGSPRTVQPRTAAELMQSYRPRIAGLQHTAPAYDRLVEPRRVPVPAACVESRSNGCRCYTQDATVYTTSLEICRQIVRNGLWLDFSPDGRQPQTVAQNAPVPLPGPDAGPSGPVLISGPGWRDPQGYRGAQH